MDLATILYTLFIKPLVLLFEVIFVISDIFSLMDLIFTFCNLENDVNIVSSTMIIKESDPVISRPCAVDDITFFERFRNKYFFII